MKLKVISVLILVTFLLLTSCQQGKKKQQAPGSFIGGTQGVVAKFEAFGVEENGVYSIFDTETFPIEVTLTNKGEYELQPNEVMVELLGPSQSEFNGIASWKKSNLDIIDKISELVKEGGEETITFADEARYRSPVRGITERNWFANVEYNYKTFVIVPEVCLKYDLRDRRVCTVEEAKSFDVSGAPITIEGVTEDTAGRGIMALKFTLKNVAGGKVTLPNANFEVTDKLAYSLDDADWECKSGGKVNEARLINGLAEIVCRLKNPLAEAHLSTKQVILTLNYKYREIVQEKLAIKESVN